MEIIINEAIFKLFPDLTISGCWVSGLKLNCLVAPNLANITIDEIRLNESLQAWKTVYKSFPCPKNSKVSLDYLGKSILKQKLKEISPVVDTYNAISIKHYVPIGGEDAVKLQNKGTQLELRLAQGHEIFYRLNQTESEVVLPNEVIWVIGNDVVCRSMNAIESDHFKITEDTVCLLFLSEALTSFDLASATKAMNELTTLFESISDDVGGFLLTSNNPKVDLPSMNTM
jgi:DNA/RNA-binding domain of Phe-tRNA-synthetase-like protein